MKMFERIHWTTDALRLHLTGSRWVSTFDLRTSVRCSWRNQKPVVEDKAELVRSSNCISREFSSCAVSSVFVRFLHSDSCRRTVSVVDKNRRWKSATFVSSNKTNIFSVDWEGKLDVFLSSKEKWFHKQRRKRWKPTTKQSSTSVNETFSLPMVDDKFRWEIELRFCSMLFDID